MREKVESVLNKLRINLQQDGGDIELVDVNNQGVVKVRLKGACCGCPMSQMTLANYIEKALKSEVPQIKKVEAVL